MRLLSTLPFIVYVSISLAKNSAETDTLKAVYRLEQKGDSVHYWSFLKDSIGQNLFDSLGNYVVVIDSVLNSATRADIEEKVDAQNKKDHWEGGIIIHLNEREVARRAYNSKKWITTGQ